jgi:hypothetical protein
MARALAFAEAAEAVGRRQEAADLFFRAGRSAAAEGREPEARLWLQAASRLATGAGTPGIRADAEAILKGIDRGAPGAARGEPSKLRAQVLDVETAAALVNGPHNRDLPAPSD